MSCFAPGGRTCLWPDQPATCWACSSALSLPSDATSAPSRFSAAAPGRGEWRLQEKHRKPQTLQRPQDSSTDTLPRISIWWWVVCLCECVSYLTCFSASGSEQSPVLKPRPSAGHGLWFFHRFPRYQSLWFSTRPITCLSANKYINQIKLTSQLLWKLTWFNNMRNSLIQLRLCWISFLLLFCINCSSMKENQWLGFKSPVFLCANLPLL